MINNELINKLIEDAKKYYKLDISFKDMEDILKISSIVNYKNGDILIEVGDEINKTGFILDGIIKSSYITYDGKDITRFFHTKYSMVLDDSLLGFNESKYRCIVVNDACVLMMDTIKLKELFKNNSVWKEFYVLALESGMRYKIYRENELMTKTAKERYLQFINDYPNILNNVNQYDIASYLGIEPQSLSRIKKELEDN